MLTQFERAEFIERCMAKAAAGIEFINRSFAQRRRYERERGGRMAHISKQWYEVKLVEKDGERQFPLGRYHAETETAAVAKAKAKHRGTTKKLELTSWEYKVHPVSGP